MSDSKPEGTARSSRRAFLKLVAAGSAAAMAAPALGLAADSRATPAKEGGTKKKTKRPADIERGIEEQKGYLKQSLEAIRGHELPTNSEQAFTFAPIKASRGARDR
jgi:hypothetical protein